jgi:hypothetical protein
MKKSAKNLTKLAVHRETLRVLANVELARVVAGVPRDDTGANGCVVKNISALSFPEAC